MLHIGVDIDGVLAVHGGNEKFFDTRIAPKSLEIIQRYSSKGVRFSIISSRINCKKETHQWLNINQAFSLFESVLLAEDHGDSKLSAAKLLKIDVMIEDTPREIDKLCTENWEIWMPVLPHNQHYKSTSNKVIRVKGRGLIPKGYVADWQDIDNRLDEKLRRFLSNS